MKPTTALFLVAFAYATIGCLLPDEVEDDEVKVVEKRQASKINFLRISSEDRFGNGKVPQGYGSKPDDFKEDKLSILSINEVGSALESLKKEYPQMELDKNREKSAEGRPIYYAVVGSDKPRVFLTGGVHARERGGPDNIIYFISDLLWADKHNTDLTYGSHKYTVSQVRTALRAGIAFIPAVNPDGILHDQTTNSCWRKNRRAFGEGRIGVDINRNFNIFRDYKRLFSGRAQVSMSTAPGPDNYIGPSPLSEPETRNIANVFNSVTSLTWYLDLHSALGKVLYSWGDDYAQTDDPTMNYMNKTWDGQRGILNTQDKNDKYKEYMEPDDFNAQKTVSDRMVKAMNSAGDDSFYEAVETIELYPSSATTDEAMAKYYNRTCGANRINALTFEFGKVKSLKPPPGQPIMDFCREVFYPEARKYRQNLLHTGVGLMEFALNAAGKAGETKLYNRPEDCAAGTGSRPQQSKPKSPLQVCVERLAPEYRKCTDEQCRTRVRQEFNTCKQSQQQPPRQPGSQEKPREPPQNITPSKPKQPSKTARELMLECLKGFRPEHSQCGTEQCRNDVVQKASNACKQSQQQPPKQQGSQEKSPQTPQNIAPSKPEQPPKTARELMQECMKGLLPEYSRCETPQCPARSRCLIQCKNTVIQKAKEKCSPRTSSNQNEGTQATRRPRVVSQRTDT